MKLSEIRSASGIVAALAACLVPATAAATEGGATNKALGVDTVLVGFIAPPGSLRSTNFVFYYTADETLGASGNPRPGISNFDLKIFAGSTRIQYGWPDAKIFGANIESRIGVVPYGNVDVSFDVQTPAGKIEKAGGAYAWFPSMLLAPVILGWQSETVHQATGLQFLLSTSPFKKDQLAHASTGFNSVAPAYWITWYPDPKVEVDGAFAYLFNAKNHTTNYTSGQEFAVDYAAGYAVTSTFQAGANGYFYQQTTDDTVNGNTVPGGNRGRAFAIGPYIRYHEDPNWGITFKWQIESLVENRAKGNRFFLQIALKLW